MGFDSTKRQIELDDDASNAPSTLHEAMNGVAGTALRELTAVSSSAGLGLSRRAAA